MVAGTASDIRHPSAITAESQVRSAVEAYPARYGTTIKAAEEVFESMTLLSRRNLVDRLLKVTIEPNPRGLRGIVTIERRA